MEWYYYPLGIAGGMLAGIINTLAGNGSAITLYLLMEVFGLAPNVANGTNRFGILTQGLASLKNYAKNTDVNFLNSAWISVPMFIGAMFGVYTAINVDNHEFKEIFKYLMILMLIVTLVKPERWLREKSTPIQFSPLWIIVFFLLGFYGGFIQMGMGIFFLAVMVLGLKYSLKDSNALKITIVTAYTAVVFTIFIIQGLVSWEFAITLALGQSSGGWLASKFAVQHPKATIWTHRLLVFVVITAVIRLFW